MKQLLSRIAIEAEAGRNRERHQSQKCDSTHDHQDAADGPEESLPGQRRVFESEQEFESPPYLQLLFIPDDSMVQLKQSPEDGEET